MCGSCCTDHHPGRGGPPATWRHGAPPSSWLGPGILGTSRTALVVMALNSRRIPSARSSSSHEYSQLGLSASVAEELGARGGNRHWAKKGFCREKRGAIACEWIGCRDRSVDVCMRVSSSYNGRCFGSQEALGRFIWTSSTSDQSV